MAQAFVATIHCFSHIKGSCVIDNVVCWRGSQSWRAAVVCSVQ